jgi:hypothetical protein
MVRALIVSCLLLGFAGACGGDDGPEDYTGAVRAGMLEGCAEDDTDADLIEVCECTYETLTDELSFAEFEGMEDRLAQGEERLPAALADAIRTCIRSVSGERGGQG